MRTARRSVELGPLLTLSDEELSRPARRREDRDVLVLRIEIEAQRREVARLITIIAGGVTDATAEATGELPADRVLLSARDLKRALGVSTGTLYRWMQIGMFPAQVHIGSLARWQRADVDAWLQKRAADRLHDDVGRQCAPANRKVRGGRSRWATSTVSEPEIIDRHIPTYEPRPTPLRGVGWRLAPGTPPALPPDHADYTVPRFGISDAARYVGLPWHRKRELIDIPHGRTTGMHYCFAQSDLDAFKATLPPPTTRRRKASEAEKG